MPDQPRIQYDYFRAMPATDVAMMLDVPRQQITKWLCEGFPTPSRMNGKITLFDSRQVIDWATKRGGLDLRGGGNKKRLNAKDPKEPKDLDEDLENPEAFSDQLERYRKLKGDQVEIDLAKKRGELIEKQAHDEFVIKAGEFVRASFQSLPRKLSVKLANETDSMKIEKILENEIVSILRELSDRKM